MEDAQYEKATFAGGCFWCMVKPFDQYPGIKKVVSAIQEVRNQILHMRKYVPRQQDIGKQYKLHLIQTLFPIMNY
jgi:hypothetical protein